MSSCSSPDYRESDDYFDYSINNDGLAYILRMSDLCEAASPKSKSCGPQLQSESTIDKEQAQDDFSERKPHRNVALIVEDRRFWVPRDYLAEYSPVFAKMLFGEFQESKKEEIELPDKKAVDILEMLQCLIPKDGLIKDISYENIVVLVKLADYYQIAFLERRCAEFIGSMIEGHQMIKQLFMDGVLLGLKQVVRVCLPLLARFDMDELRPILKGLPDQVRSATYLQIIGQGNGHYAMDSCSDCCCTCGKKCHGYPCRENRIMKQCMRCSICRKSTVWEKERDGSIRKDQNCCRCLVPYAAAELEEIGL